MGTSVGRVLIMAWPKESLSQSPTLWSGNSAVYSKGQFHPLRTIAMVPSLSSKGQVMCTFLSLKLSRRLHPFSFPDNYVPLVPLVQ